MTITDEMVEKAFIAHSQATWRGEPPRTRSALEAVAPMIRKAALEEAAKIAKGAWLSCPYGELADVDAMWALSEYTEAAIRTLADKEGA